MDNLIVLNEKRTVAKGLDPNNKINHDKLKSYVFEDDLEKLELLDKVKLSVKENPTLFYPGCGSDILFPLLYLDRLFPDLKQAQLIFADEDDFTGLIKTILDDVGICFEEGDLLKFYWKDKLISLQFIENDVFSLDLPNFDIYFEKAFRIMKEGHEDYEKKVFDKLSRNGILVSDNGFQELGLEKVEVDKDLSSYHQMIIGIKN